MVVWFNWLSLIVQFSLNLHPLSDDVHAVKFSFRYSLFFYLVFPSLALMTSAADIVLPVCWFVSRITQKLLNTFSQNSYGGWIWAWMDPVNFWCGSGWRDRSGGLFTHIFNKASLGVFVVFVNFSGNHAGDLELKEPWGLGGGHCYFQSVCITELRWPATVKNTHNVQK